MLKGNFDFKEDSFSTGLSPHRVSEQLTASMEGNFPVCLRESICFYHSVFSRNTSDRTHTHTHKLPAWLPGETTPVGVLCFHDDSKGDLESAETGAEWERGEGMRIVSE